MSQSIDISPRVVQERANPVSTPHTDGKAPSSGRVLVIDHCGHEIYARMPDDCCGVLAIGDDTTAVCGHICAHRGIPCLGLLMVTGIRSSRLHLPPVR